MLTFMEVEEIKSVYFVGTKKKLVNSSSAILFKCAINYFINMQIVYFGVENYIKFFSTSKYIASNLSIKYYHIYVYLRFTYYNLLIVLKFQLYEPRFAYTKHLIRPNYSN